MKHQENETLAYTLPAVDLADTEQRRAAAFAALAEAVEQSAKARRGYHSLDEKKKVLAARAESLRSEISTAGGGIAAAEAMGIPVPAATRPSNVSALRKELDTAESEILRLEAAKASAPDLFAPILVDLREKIASARAAYRQTYAELVVWADLASAHAAAILAEAKYIRETMGLSASIRVVAPPLHALSHETVTALFSARATLAGAVREAEPLVPPPPPKPINVLEENDKFERRNQELQAQNAAAAREWHKKRQEKEEAERRERNATALGPAGPKEIDSSAA